ncbi:enoyl-CoA hydratase-related protein [Nocardia vinacea]|uniref:enoyl-CoA hydratase-related protein n=1 Tax=Nocardia vinacea TaxID=96468 RepID=UPI001FDF59D6|nr:enoyl-CoA hydratase-related protein [Nocardia vinacea]
MRELDSTMNRDGDAAERGGDTPSPLQKDERAAAHGLAVDLYNALAEGDRERLETLLHPRFAGRATEGLPLDLGGVYDGPDAMRRDFWGRISRHYQARAVPARFDWLDDGRLMVTGRYTGTARVGHGVLDAEFVHILSFSDGRIRELAQLTDSERWRQALTPENGLRTVEFAVTDGIAVLRLNRPDQRNAINRAMADDLYEVAQRCVARSDLRALVVMGNGPAFTVGGDITVFADTEPEELSTTLRHMATPYHEALRLFAELPVPVVTAVHGSAGGGGLGLVYCADVALAAQGTKFATGFTALGLSGDGGTSWYLPRLVGLRRAQALYLGRVLDAHEACEWGLISEVVAADQLEETALNRAAALAAGPTRAYAEIRTLLRKSGSSTLSEQLAAEIDALARTAGTVDAARAVRSFIAKSEPAFEGR